MNMLALWAILVIIGAGLGTGVTKYIDNIKIDRLELDLKQIKLESAVIFNEQTAKIQAKTAENIKFNQELDTSNAQHLQTINTLHATLTNYRLHSANPTSNKNTLSGSNCTQNSTNQTNPTQFSAGLIKLSAERAYSADINSEYALTCYKFVIENNCGIPK